MSKNLVWDNTIESFHPSRNLAGPQLDYPIRSKRKALLWDNMPDEK